MIYNARVPLERYFNSEQCLATKVMKLREGRNVSMTAEQRRIKRENERLLRERQPVHITESGLERFRNGKLVQSERNCEKIKKVLDETGSVFKAAELLNVTYRILQLFVDKAMPDYEMDRAPLSNDRAYEIYRKTITRNEDILRSCENYKQFYDIMKLDVNHGLSYYAFMKAFEKIFPKLKAEIGELFAEKKRKVNEEVYAFHLVRKEQKKNGEKVQSWSQAPWAKGLNWSEIQTRVSCMETAYRIGARYEQR